MDWAAWLRRGALALAAASLTAGLAMIGSWDLGERLVVAAVFFLGVWALLLKYLPPDGVQPALRRLQAFTFSYPSPCDGVRAFVTCMKAVHPPFGEREVLEAVCGISPENFSGSLIDMQALTYGAKAKSFCRLLIHARVANPLSLDPDKRVPGNRVDRLPWAIEMIESTDKATYSLEWSDLGLTTFEHLESRASREVG